MSHVFIGNGSGWTCFDLATMSWEEIWSSHKEECFDLAVIVGIMDLAHLFYSMQ